MKIPQSRTQKIQAGLHCSQAVFIFIAGCLTLAVMTKPGGFGGSTAFFFALCFLTLPAILYQVLVPLWSRAWRLNNVYAFASVDILFAILWFAASIAVAVWNAHGIAQGRPTTTDDKDPAPSSTKRADVLKDGTCASFAYGSETKCKVSKASVGIGIVIFLIFALASYFSIRSVIEYKRTGVKSNVMFPRHAHGKAEMLGEDPDPWSTDTDELKNQDRTSLGGFKPGDREGLLHPDADEEGDRPLGGMAPLGREMNYPRGAQFLRNSSYEEKDASSAFSPTGWPTTPEGGNRIAEVHHKGFR